MSIGKLIDIFMFEWVLLALIWYYIDISLFMLHSSLCPVAVKIPVSNGDVLLFQTDENTDY